MSAPTEPGYYWACHKKTPDKWEIVQATNEFHFREGLFIFQCGWEVPEPIDDFVWGEKVERK